MREVASQFLPIHIIHPLPACGFILCREGYTLHQLCNYLTSYYLAVVLDFGLGKQKYYKMRINSPAR